MQNFCPLCLKNGTKKKIKAFQVNLQEAVWVCEEKECIWPFGYQNLMFFQRAANSIDLEELDHLKESIPISMELSLYTPPVTPSGEFSKEFIDIGSNEYLTNLLTEDKGIKAFPKKGCNGLENFTDTSDLPLLEPIKSKNNTFIERNGNNMKENMNTKCGYKFKTLSKLNNVERTNINVASVSLCSNNFYANQKLQKQFSDSPTCDIIKDFSYNKQEERENNEKKSDNMQLVNESNYIGTNTSLDKETLSRSVNMDIAANTTTDQNTLHISTGDILDSDLNIDTILEDIMSGTNGSDIEEINDDWLNSFIT